MADSPIHGGAPLSAQDAALAAADPTALALGRALEIAQANQAATSPIAAPLAPPAVVTPAAPIAAPQPNLPAPTMPDVTGYVAPKAPEPPPALSEGQLAERAATRYAQNQNLNNEDVLALAKTDPYALGGAGNGVGTKVTTGQQSTVSTQGMRDNPAWKAAREATAAQRERMAQESIAAGEQQDKAAQQVAGVVGQQAQFLQAEAARQKADDDARRAQFDQLISEQKQLQDDYANKVEAFNPNRMMHGRNKVLAALAVGLGGWGGGHNDAADVVKGAIDRDLAKQQAGVKAAGARVDANNDLWNKLRTLSGDNATAAAAYRATQLSAYASQVEQLAQLQRGADAKTKALQVAQQLRLDSAVENERAQQLLAQQVNSSTTTTSQMVDGATLARGKMEAETDLIKKLTAQQELESKIAKNNPENPTDADEARATKAAAETGKWLGAYNTVEDLAKQVAKANYLARKSGFGESGAAFDAQKAMVTSQLTTAITGAAASTEQRKDIMAMIEGPINTYDQLQARLRQVRQAIADITSGHYAGVHDTIRQRTLENVIKQGRISPHNARALFYGGDIQDTASEGEALGGKPYSR